MKSKKGGAIGLDMDGVIIDNMDTKIRFAKKLGFALKPEQTHADLIEKTLTSEALSELRTHLYFNPVTALQAKLVPGSLDGLRQLKKIGQRFYLISKRKYPFIAKELLKKHKLWGKYFDEKNTFFVREAEEKDYQISRLGIGLYLDDQPSILDKLVSVKNKILFDRFNCFTNSKHTRVDSWDEFLNIIKTKELKV